MPNYEIGVFPLDIASNSEKDNIAAPYNVYRDRIHEYLTEKGYIRRGLENTFINESLTEYVLADWLHNLTSDPNKDIFKLAPPSVDKGIGERIYVKSMAQFFNAVDRSLDKLYKGSPYDYEHDPIKAGNMASRLSRDRFSYNIYQDVTLIMTNYLYGIADTLQGAEKDAYIAAIPRFVSSSLPRVMTKLKEEHVTVSVHLSDAVWDETGENVINPTPYSIEGVLITEGQNDFRKTVECQVNRILATAYSHKANATQAEVTIPRHFTEKQFDQMIYRRMADTCTDEYDRMKDVADFIAYGFTAIREDLLKNGFATKTSDGLYVMSNNVEVRRAVSDLISNYHKAFELDEPLGAMELAGAMMAMR